MNLTSVSNPAQTQVQFTGRKARTGLLAGLAVMAGLSLPAPTTSTALARVSIADRFDLMPNWAADPDIKLWEKEVTRVFKKERMLFKEISLTPTANDILLELDNDTFYKIHDDINGHARIDKYSKRPDGTRRVQQWEIGPSDYTKPNSPLKARYYEFNNGVEEPPLGPFAEKRIHDELQDLINRVSQAAANVPR